MVEINAEPFSGLWMNGFSSIKITFLQNEEMQLLLSPVH